MDGGEFLSLRGVSLAPDPVGESRSARPNVFPAGCQLLAAEMGAAWSQL